VQALRRLRLERERAAVQEAIAEIDRTGGDAGRIQGLWTEKTRLSRLLEEM
jgi:hypothetical protein